MEATIGSGEANSGGGPIAPARTSALLRELVAEVEGASTTIGWLLRKLQQRAFGYALLVFALPSCLPMPPGIPMVCGIVLAIVGTQMMVGSHPLWMPRFISRREIGKETLEGLVTRASRWIEKLERLARPRLPVMTGRVGYRVIGAVVFVLAFIMALPIPFLGNMPPAVAVVVIAIGLTEGDGLIVAIGLAVSVVALFLSGAFAIEAVKLLLAFVT